MYSQHLSQGKYILINATSQMFQTRQVEQKYLMDEVILYLPYQLTVQRGSS